MNNLYTALVDQLVSGLVNGTLNAKNIDSFYPLLKQGLSIIYPNETVDDEMVIRQALANFDVYVGDPSFLDNNKDHEEWLADEKTEIEWKFWDRYKHYLESTEKMPPGVVDDINKRTDDILGRLESPRRKGKWDRRGLVVGNVQSGKTGNYIGLICKAVDAGYKVIIVLAGLNNDLRRQTQLRVDSGFVGRNSVKKENYNQSSSRTGAGLLIGYEVPPVTTITTSELNGDYRKGAHSVTPTIGGDPIIAVVKKNVTPLKNLLSLFSGYNTSGVIPNVPLLVIDDEADNASIDTNSVNKIDGDTDSEEKDPTKINGYIRQILNCFSQSAYVAYTATPFANMYIYQGEKDGFGEDLFPRSFAAVLEAPSNYMGPDQLFGLYKDPIAGIKEKEPYPLIRRISDYVDVFPEKHKKDQDISYLPDSLYTAMYSFILTVASRNARGQGSKHQSMLVHVTRFIDVQHQVKDLIQKWKEEVERSFEMKTGPQYKKHLEMMRTIWETDYVPTIEKMKAIVDDRMCTELSWSQIEQYLYKCISKIQVKEINGKAADGGLDYEHNPNGLYVIAIGGDKLSRGLTLEGLSVSYYIRTSKMYDTLMQMGRWFGYRDGYVDLCRLYTSPQLVDWYQHIAVANLELRNEFKDMANMNSDPEHYGIKVRTHPKGMLITALNKMRNSKECKVTYSGSLIQIPRYYKNNEINKNNIDFTSKWLIELGKPSKYPSEETYWNYLWEDVPADEIITFINNVKIHSTCFDASPNVTSHYIQALNQEEDPELIKWTVELVSNKVLPKNIDTSINVGGVRIIPTWRTDANAGEDSDTVTMQKDALITEVHQSVDLSEKEYQEALEETITEFESGNSRVKSRPTIPSPRIVREHRSYKKGLLIIQIFESGIDNEHPYDELYLGYAISFPKSKTAQEITYKVDEVYWDKVTEDAEY